MAQLALEPIEQKFPVQANRNRFCLFLFPVKISLSDWNLLHAVIGRNYLVLGEWITA